MQKYFLVVDTETSGLPKNWSAPYTSDKNWPHILQIAWVIYNADYQEIKRENHYLKNPGLLIDKTAQKIHNITTEYLRVHGEDKEKVLLRFYADIEKYQPLVVGHFIELDYHMINVELFRIGKTGVFDDLPFFCTMKASADYITNSVISHLKLDKFYTILFNEVPENMHNALADALSAARIFFHLLESNKLSLMAVYNQKHTFNQKRAEIKVFSFKQILRRIFNGR